ncbi:acetyl-CoA synthetase-like protein [Dacryopinax primogenitus]|uniref:Acetyl-CoA synthetase-like protein n=1 Tax=Dacryopinax primogenitus (strain DJM 731) TaxID=1858805 RepID=M5FN65_DACPD|nr:acetyl-CoA synthetase-like protein [Dacryopinax primogenitus]EJT96905.1 acetyl-CoA synthetase-like protein [Dacryopinax primogenitus]
MVLLSNHNVPTRLFDVMDACDTLQSPCTASSTNLTSFVLPPSDGSIAFPQLLDFHLENNPDYPYAVLVSLDDDPDENVTVTWAEVARASFRLAAKLRTLVKVSDEQRREGVRIAILANTDTLTYVTLIFSVFRAGFVAFPLSTRNSAAPALEHLIQTTNTAYVIGSIAAPGSAPTSLEETTATLLAHVPTLQLLEFPGYADLYPRLSMSPIPPYDAEHDAIHTPKLPSVESFPEYKDMTNQNVLMILHSSGSTGFHKAIPMTHRFLNFAFRSHGNSVTATRCCLLGLPVFHAMGIFVMVGLPATYGTTNVMFKPSSGHVIPSPEVVLRGSQRGRADYLLAAPSYCAEWSHHQESVKYLTTLKSLMYGGGPLAADVGDRLVREGVKVISVYGMTEVAQIFALKFDVDHPEDWSYSELHPSLRAEFVPEGDNLYRLIVIDTDNHPIAISNQTNVSAFDTKDLLEQHPTRRHLWKTMGRVDDLIVMSNREKTNPSPMESILNGNPHIRASMMFGSGRFQVGVAIEPAGHICSITNDESLAEFRNLIWPDVEKANTIAPQHSRIFKELILVIDPKGSSFTRTPKGSINRNSTLQQLADEIDALYAAAEQLGRKA